MNRARVYMPDHPGANTQGQVYRYRLVMEKKLGRYLQPGELVHHKNENPRDDHPDNLELKTRATHGQEHTLAKSGKWSRSHPACVDCGTTSVPHRCNGQCKTCYWQKYRRP